MLKCHWFTLIWGYEINIQWSLILTYLKKRLFPSVSKSSQVLMKSDHAVSVAHICKGEMVIKTVTRTPNTKSIKSLTFFTSALSPAAFWQEISIHHFVIIANLGIIATEEFTVARPDIAPCHVNTFPSRHAVTTQHILLWRVEHMRWGPSEDESLQVSIMFPRRLGLENREDVVIFVTSPPFELVLTQLCSHHTFTVLEGKWLCVALFTTTILLHSLHLSLTEWQTVVVALLLYYSSVNSLLLPCTCKEKGLVIPSPGPCIVFHCVISVIRKFHTEMNLTSKFSVVIVFG